MRAARQLALEGALVSLCGLVFAFAANEFSPHGLVLGRNYFPGAARPFPSRATATNAAPAAGGTNVLSATPAELLAARLKANGLQLADSNLVMRLFRDQRYAEELVVFVDARDDQHYQKGHVPGAYQFDHYRPEKHLGIVLPVCQTAEQILVYCNGGGCEDSEFAAITLMGAGISKEKLSVYAGGMTEWMTNGLPVETGARKSGQMLNANQ